jgi:hypothetical protein
MYGNLLNYDRVRRKLCGIMGLLNRRVWILLPYEALHSLRDCYLYFEDRYLARFERARCFRKVSNFNWSTLNFYYSLILEILLNFTLFGLLLYGLALMWLKKKMMTMFHFLIGFFFCTDYDNDFKVVCTTFCKLYPSFREPAEFLLVWSFLYIDL